MLYSQQDIARLGTILTIWAHPDDETWCAGGLLALAALNGQHVVGITATKGDAGKTADKDKWPQKHLGTIRQSELIQALEVLGVHEWYMLDYVDGTLADCDATTAITELATHIGHIQPNTIITFGHDGITGHTDHQTISDWVKKAHAKANSTATVYAATETTEQHDNPCTAQCDKKFGLYFKNHTPRNVKFTDCDLAVTLPAGIQTIKREALRSHHCQTEQLFADTDGCAYIENILQHEAFIKL